MNFETMTYDMKILTLPTADERLRTSLRAAADMAPRGRAVSGLLIWLRLWLTCLGLERFSQNRSSTPQDPRPPSLLPNAARAAYAPRLQANRRARRIMARGLPASRCYAALHHLNGRILTLGQFMERACKISTSGRIVVYRLSGRKRLCQRREEVLKAGTGRAQSERKRQNKDGLNLGLCEAHIWPN